MICWGRKSPAKSSGFACASRGIWREPEAAKYRSSNSSEEGWFPEREPRRTDEPQIWPEGELRKQRSFPGRMVVWTRQRCREKDRAVMPREVVIVQTMGRCTEAAKADFGGA